MQKHPVHEPFVRKRGGLASRGTDRPTLRHYWADTRPSRGMERYRVRVKGIDSMLVQVPDLDQHVNVPSSVVRAPKARASWSTIAECHVPLRPLL